MNLECNYPEGFYTYGDGVTIPDQTINEWIKDCINLLESNKEINHSSISSGDTLVSVTRYYYDENDDRYYYEVVVAKGYSEKYLGLEQFD